MSSELSQRCVVVTRSPPDFSGPNLSAFVPRRAVESAVSCGNRGYPSRKSRLGAPGVQPGGWELPLIVKSSQVSRLFCWVPSR